MLHTFLSTHRTPEAYKATLELHMAAITTNDNIFRQYLLNIPTCIQLIALTSEESTDDELYGKSETSGLHSTTTTPPI